METKEIVKIEGLVMNRSTVEETRQEIANRIDEGILDPVKTFAAIKFYQKVFDGDDKKNNGLTHLIKEKVITQIEQDKTRLDWYGYKVEVKEAGARYDFSNCNDDVLDGLIEKFNEAKEKLEERQAFLKTIKDHLDIITEDGEPKTIYPPVKKSTTSPTFTFSK
jgi:hypothetical protein